MSAELVAMTAVGDDIEGLSGTIELVGSVGGTLGLLCGSDGTFDTSVIDCPGVCPESLEVTTGDTVVLLLGITSDDD